MRPNILLIHSDQHRYDSLACHGHSVVKTPNLDRLARGGVDCSAAFTPCPVCTPSRASLLTGRWPTQHRSVCIPNTEHYQPVLDGSTILWDVLRSAGYQQALVGKFHNETAKSPEHYIDRFVSEHDYFKFRDSLGIPKQPSSNGWFGEVDPHIDSQQHRLAWEADHVRSIMHDFASAGRPWMIRWDPSEPHLPNRIPRDLKDLYPPSSIPPWPSFADTLTGKPFIQSQQRRTWGVDGWTWEKWAPVVSRYLAEITLMDAQIGRVIESLDATGQRENTLIVYSTDHGDFCGGHGQMDKHFALYDDLVRIPLILNWPGKLPAGRICDEFIAAQIDLATTITTLATESNAPSEFMGVDLLPVLQGSIGTNRTDIFAQYMGTQFGLYSERMLRDRHWKYVWNPTDIDELYHLDTDPAELINLAQRVESRDTLMRLRGRLIDWMESIGDPLLNEFTRCQLTRYGVKP
jgi:arylsulfatase A-like enzyme